MKCMYGSSSQNLSWLQHHFSCLSHWYEILILKKCLISIKYCRVVIPKFLSTDRCLRCSEIKKLLGHLKINFKKTLRNRELNDAIGKEPASENRKQLIFSITEENAKWFRTSPAGGGKKVFPVMLRRKSNLWETFVDDITKAGTFSQSYHHHDAKSALQ